MTTYYQFIPNSKSATTFNMTFDNNPYIVTVVWNVSANRYYISCNALDGTLIFFVPLVESIVSYQITNLVYDESNARVVGTLALTNALPVGTVFNASIINSSPIGYNGNGLAFVLSSTQFVYPMVMNPGTPSVFGSLRILISLTSGYFNSTLIYQNNIFEVTP